MHAKDIQTAVGQLIVEIEVGGLFIVPVDFVLFTDEKAVIVVDAVDAPLQ